MADSWAIRLIRTALKLQDRITVEVSPELKVAGAGRKARIVVEGNDGGEMYLKWTGDRLLEDDHPEAVRNNFFLHSQTLFDLATGELGAREALAARLVRVTGDRSIYDQEDIMKLFEKLQNILALHLKNRGG